MGHKKITPEKRVEGEIKSWLFLNGFHVDVYDSKGSFSQAAGRFVRNRSMKTGTPDLLGLSSQGYFVALELKANGKEKVCRIEQRHFLENIIQKNGFGLVVSSVSYLSEIWSQWISFRESGKLENARNLLLKNLPSKVIADGKILQLSYHNQEAD